MNDLRTTHERINPCGSVPLRVALYLDRGCRGGGAIRWAQLLRLSPDVESGLVDAADVMAGKLRDYNVRVMPGGGGYERYAQLGEAGFDRIRAFVRGGGGYYGTCGGFALALNEPKRLRLIPFAREKTPVRGGFSGAVALNGRAEERMGVPSGIRDFFFHDGPVAVPGEPVPDAECEVLATFESELMQRGRAATPMFGTPAIVFGRYGLGKVFVTVMHPEYHPATLDVLAGGFRALTGRAVRILPPPRKGPRPLRVAFYASEIDRQGDALPVRAIVENALALAERPDVDITFVSGEDIAHGALEHADALVLPGGGMEAFAPKDSPDAAPLVESFRASGGIVAAAMPRSTARPTPDEAEATDTTRLFPLSVPVMPPS